jgi:ABC-2 type transport system ATP-binding protein
MEHAVEISGVTKTFGTTRAVDDLNLVVRQGTTYGVIGPSGAGKTTAIRMILSILFPDRGTLTVLGKKSALEAKDRIGYLPEERGSYRKMRVNAFLRYLAGLKSVPAQEADKRAGEMLERLGLGDAATKKCEDLSKGMLQRVQFVGAIINRPDLLILDEPFSGLDPVSVRVLRGVIADEQRRGATILFSTHVMANAEELCEQIVMIHKGRKVLDEPMTGLRRKFDMSTIRLEPLDPAAHLAALKDLPGVANVQMTPEGCEIRIVPGTEPTEMMRAIAACVPPARIEIARVRLEDVFIRIVGEASGSGETADALRSHLQGLGTGTEGAAA